MTTHSQRALILYRRRRFINHLLTYLLTPLYLPNSCCKCRGRFSIRCFWSPIFVICNFAYFNHINTVWKQLNSIIMKLLAWSSNDWAYAAKFTRWQHHAVWCGARFPVPDITCLIYVLGAIKYVFAFTVDHCKVVKWKFWNEYKFN